MNLPIAVVRDISSSPQNGRGAHSIAGRVAGGASKTVTIETGLRAIISAVVINETDGAVVATTIASSTATTGTKKVSFAVANSKKYSYLIVGSYIYDVTVPSITADTTITYNPLIS